MTTDSIKFPPGPGAAGGSVLTSILRGLVMIVAYEPPHPHSADSLRALTLTHEEGPNADGGSFQAAHGNPICATP